MEVYLLRHGIAEEGGSTKPDAERALTAEGKRKLRHILRLSSDAQVEPGLILSSPLRRALETAEIARNVLKCKHAVSRSKALAPGGSVEQVWDEIRAHKDLPSVLLVGHNPQFAELAAYLLGAREVRVDFKKGAILRVDFESFGPRPHGMLRWYLTGKLATNAD
ncbi:MAG: phosphohistidine phosphatase SixA [Acidobacteriaceae bacterium]|nr:phosphohistidine phosphatase SixA [Acidobacteriaceae bacterium]MBV9443747.1 phosphohistidine phosphatase SixA [Acidobacteriaceae bacterium]